jgi:hypothetical protein
VNNGGWGWVDGSAVTCSSWNFMEPSGDGTCGHFNRTWNDQSCGSSSGALCQFQFSSSTCDSTCVHSSNQSTPVKSHDGYDFYCDCACEPGYEGRRAPRAPKAMRATRRARCAQPRQVVTTMRIRFLSPKISAFADAPMVTQVPTAISARPTSSNTLLAALAP